MALEWEETCLDVTLSDYDANAVIHLQAICRGWLVRKKLKDAQTEFEDIVRDLDGPVVTVDWTESPLPRPVVRKTSRKARGKRDQEHTCPQSCDSRWSSVGKSRVESECVKCAAKTATQVRIESDDEREKQPVKYMPDADRTQSDQEVQTEVKQHLLESEHTENDGTCNPGAEYNSLPVKEQISETENEVHTRISQDSAKKDPLTEHEEAGKDGGKDKLENLDNSDTNRPSLNIPNSVGSDAESPNLLPPVQSVVSSDGLTAVITESVSESSGVKRTNSIFGDQTSVWDSSSSVLQDAETAWKGSQGHVDRPVTRAAERDKEPSWDQTEMSLRTLSTEDLMKQRQNMAMELLWVQQAIISRKKYLSLKRQMETAS